VDVIVLGHLGTRYLAAAALANAYLLFTSNWVWQGVGNAVNTLGWPGFGAGNPRLVGVWAQLGVCALLAASVPIGALWASAGSVLAAAGFSAQLAADAGLFASIFVGFLVPNLLFLGLSNYLQALGVILPQVCISASVAALDLGLNLVLVFGVGGWGGLGFVGRPLQRHTASWVGLTALVATMPRLQAVRDTWDSGRAAGAGGGRRAGRQPAAPCAAWWARFCARQRPRGWRLSSSRDSSRPRCCWRPQFRGLPLRGQ
jgi:MATE family multidrug resistance protein